MIHEGRIIEGPYLRDLLAQPQALEATLSRLEIGSDLLRIAGRLKERVLERVVLTGMGSSLHALHPLHIELTAHGHASVIAETSELVHYMPRLFEARTLIVTVSQSGKSAEVVRLLEENGGRAAVIGVTNTPDSPLARLADAVMLTQAGEEFSVSCKTYVTALMALRLLGAVLCGSDVEAEKSELARAPGAAAGYLGSWRDHVAELLEDLEGIRHLFLVGRGASLAAAGTGALIVKESAHLHAEGMSSAAFRHGPMEMLGAYALVLVFSGDARTAELNCHLLEDIRGHGQRGEMVGPEASRGALRLPAVPPGVQPIVEILPVEMITLALAAQAGIEAGRFSLGSKITTTE